MHGRLSRAVPVAAARCPLLHRLPAEGVEVVRYHSLVVDEATLPEEIVPTAWCVDAMGDGSEVRVLMAVRHALYPRFGVQFHPESVLTDCGKVIAENFVRIARQCRARRGVDCVPRAMVPEVRGVEGGDGVRRGEELVVRYRRLACSVADSARVFDELYGEADRAFWLDSSSSATSASLSRCSSLELQPARDGRGQSPSPPQPPVDLRGRFSLMGDLSGPRAELVTYSVPEMCVRVSAGEQGGAGVGKEEKQLREELYGVSIFDYLQQQLARRRVCVPASGDSTDSGMENGSDHESEGGLPIDMHGGYVGYVGYEVKANTNAGSNVVNVHRSNLPDAWFVFADRVVVYDHSDRSLFLVAVINGKCCDEESAAEQWFSTTERRLALLSGFQGVPPAVISHSLGEKLPTANSSSDNADRLPLRFSLDRGRASYEEDVSRCLEYIAAGESYEICLTNRLRCELPQNGRDYDVLSIYKTLRLVNPAPYAAFLRLDKDTAICCSSPERFLRASSDGIVESKPIKGTRPRGVTVAEDEALANDLRTSEKDRSENLMIVDLVRNDLSRSCAVGTVSVPALMQVETYASVHQLVSTVRGMRQEGTSMVSCVRAAYPMGSMTGAPKVRTMNLIDELEASARGVYSGSIGYLSLCGAADLNVVIRTAVVAGSTVEVGVGGAVVAMSSPREEYEEILVKGRPIMQTIALAATGSNVYCLDEGASPRDALSL